MTKINRESKGEVYLAPQELLDLKEIVLDFKIGSMRNRE